MRACRVGTVLVFKCGARAVVRVERSVRLRARSARSPRCAISADARRRISAQSAEQRWRAERQAAAPCVTHSRSHLVSSLVVLSDPKSAVFTSRNHTYIILKP